MSRRLLAIALVGCLAGCSTISEIGSVFDSTVTRTKKDADRGDAEAQLALGKRYTNGDKVPRDSVMAVYWYRKAAEQANPEASYLLASAFEHGTGIPRDPAQAIAWYEYAAKTGMSDAHYPLAGLYRSNAAKQADYVLALMHYDLAAARAIGLVRQRALVDRYDLARKMPPEQIAEADNLKTLWYQAWVSPAK